MDFKTVDKKYRVVPFWSWNEKLDPKETRRQVALMDEAGVGGFFMHARGGLLTEYMGESWFKNVKAATEEANARGMHAWAYDENGWPSGFGGGRVNEAGVRYQQKNLGRCRESSPLPSGAKVLLTCDGYHYYYTVNPHYVDLLDAAVVKKFIDEVHEEYFRRMGNTIRGIFTDEPQLGREEGYPWSSILPDAFSEKYGYPLIEHLPELFEDVGAFRQTRFDFWRLVTSLFSESYFKQVGDYCRSHGYQFTGHEMWEERLSTQMAYSGAAMPHYEYFDVPGMDWLGRRIFDSLTHMQVSSVAAQMGQRQVISETFALCGHNVSHDELKRIFEWQMVRGINLLCTHLQGYSLRGIRKRDYPPAMYYQQPWWEDMGLFFEAMGRVGMLLAEGTPVADTLVIHPQSSAWVLYRGTFARPASFEESEPPRLSEINDALLEIMGILERKHILYHFGDETIMERHAKVKDGKIVIGKMAYSRVILPPHEILFENTERLLAQFIEQGGIVTTAKDIPENPITQPSALTYTMREFADFNMHYFVNSTERTITADIRVGSAELDIRDGTLRAFGGKHTFGKYESIVVLEDKKDTLFFDDMPRQMPKTRIALPEKWQVEDATYNSLTLDRCDYYFDGKLIEKNGYVLDILPRLNALRRPVKLLQMYTFVCETVPEEVFLCTETPDLFEIEVNGTPLEKKDAGYFRDTSMRLLSIAGMLKEGANEIVLRSEICQSKKVFRHIDRSWAFETMKNSLSYTQEIEQIYLVGRFGTKCVGEQEPCDLNAYRISEVPHITAMPTEVDLEHLENSGFAEFCGTLRISAEITVRDKKRALCFEKWGINTVGVEVGGKDLGTFLFAPYIIDLSRALEIGKNKITLTLRNNLRNMQGPFHLKEGECIHVAPGSFYRESNVFAHPQNATENDHSVLDAWDDRITLVRMGLKSKL